MKIPELSNQKLIQYREISPESLPFFYRPSVHKVELKKAISSINLSERQDPGGRSR